MILDIQFVQKYGYNLIEETEASLSRYSQEVGYNLNNLRIHSYSAQSKLYNILTIVMEKYVHNDILENGKIEVCNLGSIDYSYKWKGRNLSGTVLNLDITAVVINDTFCVVVGKTAILIPREIKNILERLTKVKVSSNMQLPNSTTTHKRRSRQANLETELNILVSKHDLSKQLEQAVKAEISFAAINQLARLYGKDDVSLIHSDNSKVHATTLQNKKVVTTNSRYGNRRFQLRFSSFFLLFGLIIVIVFAILFFVF